MQIQVEVSQLVDEVNRISSHAQFNGYNMLTGAFANPNEGGTPTSSIGFTSARTWTRGRGPT
jgi:flagellin